MLIVEFLCLHAGISPFMTDVSFLHEFVKPIEVKRMTVRERSTLTDILYGIPDKNLPAYVYKLILYANEK